MKLTSSLTVARIALTAVAAATLLSACAPLVIGGAMVGASLVAIDRRSSGTQLDDQSIELKAVNRIADAVGDRGHAIATSYNRVLLLSGEVPTLGDKVKVEQNVSTIEGVTSVVNELLVGPSTSLSERSNDTVITSKVKAAFLDAKDLQANVFKVVTERGIVYLMGVVSEREASRAAEVARGVGGVQKVVRVFQIVSEAELSNLQAAPASK
ncbi:MAG: BON domain-containing protein [Proteobacteria bacterium]|nr:BON domain-containing protein [Pseudomonadota bacterium]